MRIRHLKSDGTPAYTNRLISEGSPYLLQHAHNPVEWYPWGEEAFARARAEGKPVHLSIGYSACHWCHVLAEESFEDEETAALLNERFINIKVDREERPDIDRIYQIAQQLITRRSGGWPLTMFLTADDQRPFFGGTYFPDTPRHGMPAFRDVLRRVADYYRDHQAELREQNRALMQVFEDLEPAGAAADVALTAAPLKAAREQFAASFDKHFGGFGSAPKFPHPLTLVLLLHRWYASARAPEPDLHALYMATLTLRRMGEGGLQDQLGGGFFRYSVDPYWMIPHFEKMLYDNGGLLAAYAEAARATGDPFYAAQAAATASWAMREIQSGAGGFYSSFDADSEGHEGRFYVWERREVERALNESEYAAFAPRFGLDREPNFEGRWHLHTFRSIEEIAQQLGETPEETRETIEAARRTLLALRGGRVRPSRDDKILTSWNALMIRGMAIAARALEREDLTASATRALAFVRRTLWREGRLLAAASGERARLDAYLDDYVYLIDAILELQQVRFVAEELDFARELSAVVMRHFADARAGGFFFTADDHERLMHRPKSFADDAIPSGNGIAAFVLQRMGYLLAEPALLAAAEGVLRAAWGAIEQAPGAHVALLLALEEFLEPPQIVILRGEREAIESWQRALAPTYAPHRLVLAIPAQAAGLPPALAEKSAHGAAVAYVCTGNTCSAPLASLEELIRALGPAA